MQRFYDQVLSVTQKFYYARDIFHLWLGLHWIVAKHTVDHIKCRSKILVSFSGFSVDIYKKNYQKFTNVDMNNI